MNHGVVWHETHNPEILAVDCLCGFNITLSFGRYLTQRAKSNFAAHLREMMLELPKQQAILDATPAITSRGE